MYAWQLLPPTKIISHNVTSLHLNFTIIQSILSDENNKIDWVMLATFLHLVDEWRLTEDDITCTKKMTMNRTRKGRPKAFDIHTKSFRKLGILLNLCKEQIKLSVTT